MGKTRSAGNLVSENILSVDIVNDRVGIGTTIPTATLNVAGIVSATAFYGDGINLTNTGSTLSSTSGTERLVLTNLTSGTMTASSTDANLTFDANTSTLNVVNANVSGIVTAGTFTGSELSITNANVSGIVTAGTFTGGAFKNYSESVYAFGNTGTAPSLSLANGNFVTATLNGNAVFTFNLTGCPSGNFAFTLHLTNDATAGRSITWPASVRWPNGSVPVRTTTANRTDVYTFYTFNGGSIWYGNLSLYNYS